MYLKSRTRSLLRVSIMVIHSITQTYINKTLKSNISLNQAHESQCVTTLKSVSEC
jgi:hypothetical protein